MSINSVKYHAGIVIEHLKANDLADTAAEVERATAHLDIEMDVEQALNRLIAYCNVRALAEAPVGTMTLEAWLLALGKLDRACRRALKERGGWAPEGTGTTARDTAERAGTSVPFTGFTGFMGAGAYISAAFAALREPPTGSSGAMEFTDTTDDGETAALRHFIAAGAFVLAMMAAVVFVLTVYRVPNLWTLGETSTVSRSIDGAMDHQNTGVPNGYDPTDIL